MTKVINPIPRGYRSATPALVIRGADAAIDFYTNVFGAVELSRINGMDGISIQRAEIKIGNSVLHISDELPEFGILSPLSLGGTSGSVQLYLDGIASVWDLAIKEGSAIVLPLEDTYWGERTGRIVDPFGHVWTLSQRVEAVSKTELAIRIAERFDPKPISEQPQDEIIDHIPTVDIRGVGVADSITNSV